MHPLSPTHQGSTFLYYDYKRINPDYINNLRWFLLKNVMVHDKRKFEGSRDFVHSACSTPVNLPSTSVKVFNRLSKRASQNSCPSVSLNKHINERQIKRHFLQSFHHLINKSQVKYYSHSKFYQRRSKSDVHGQEEKTFDFARLIQENGPYEKDTTPNLKIRSGNRHFLKLSEAPKVESSIHNSNLLKQKMSKNVLKEASFKLQQKKSSFNSQSKGQNSFNLKQFLQFEKMGTQKQNLLDLSPVQPDSKVKSGSANVLGFQRLDTKQKASKAKLNQIGFLKKKLVSFRKLSLIKHSTKNFDHLVEIKSAIPAKLAHQISPIISGQECSNMLFSQQDLISQHLDAKRNKFLESSISKSSETDMNLNNKDIHKSFMSKDHKIKQARKKLNLKSKTSDPKLNILLKETDGNNTHDNPSANVLVKMDQQSSTQIQIIETSNLKFGPRSSCAIVGMNKQITMHDRIRSMRQVTHESQESESLSSNPDEQISRYKENNNMKINTSSKDYNEHKSYKQSPIKQKSYFGLRSETNISQQFSSRDYKEIKHNWQRSHKLHILRCINKEQEQVASLKFLRILGNHLKEPSQNSLVKGANAQEMRKIYNEINLNNVVSQLEDNIEEDMNSFDRQFLKYNSMYMNYIDTEGSIKQLPQVIDEECHATFSESLISDSSYRSQDSRKLKIEMRKMLEDQNIRSTIKQQIETSDDLIIEENNIIEEESVSCSQLDNSSKAIQRNQPVNFKMPPSPLNSIKEIEVNSDSAEQAKKQSEEETIYISEQISDNPEDHSRYLENMAKLKRQQFIEKKSYEIQSITEAGIEDGSSVFLSEFKSYGKRHQDTNKDKMKLMNKLHLIKSNGSVEFKQDSAKSEKQINNSTAIKDILLRESKIKDAMTPQEVSQNRFQQDLMYQPIYLNDTDSQSLSPANITPCIQFKKPVEIVNQESPSASNGSSESEQDKDEDPRPTMNKLNLMNNRQNLAVKVTPRSELNKLSKSSSLTSNDSSKVKNDDRPFNKSKSNSSSIQSLCEESDVSGLYKEEMTRILSQGITEDQPKRVLMNDTRYVTQNFKDEENELEYPDNEGKQPMTPNQADQNSSQDHEIEKSYYFKNYNNTINNMSNIKSNFKVSSKISSMNLFGASSKQVSSKSKSVGNGSIKLHFQDDNSLKQQYQDDIEEEEKVASSDNHSLDRLNSFDTDNYNLKNIISTQVEQKNQDLQKPQLKIKSNKIQNSQNNLVKFVNKGFNMSQRSLQNNDAQNSTTNNSFRKIKPVLCKLVGPNSESQKSIVDSSSRVSKHRNINIDQELPKSQLNIQMQDSDSSTKSPQVSEQQHKENVIFYKSKNNLDIRLLQTKIDSKLSVEGYPQEQIQQQYFYEKSPTTIIEDLQLHEKSCSPDSRPPGTPRDLEITYEVQDEQAQEQPMQSSLIDPLLPESPNIQTTEDQRYNTTPTNQNNLNFEPQIQHYTVRSLAQVEEEEKKQNSTMDNSNKLLRNLIKKQSSSIKQTQLVVSDRSYNNMVGESQYLKSADQDKGVMMPGIEFSTQEGRNYGHLLDSQGKINSKISQIETKQNHPQINEQNFNFFQNTQDAPLTRNMINFYQNYLSQPNGTNHSNKSSMKYQTIKDQINPNQRNYVVPRTSLLSLPEQPPEIVLAIRKKNSIDFAQGLKLYQQQTLEQRNNNQKYQNTIYRTVQNSRNVTPRKNRHYTNYRLVEKKFSQNFLINFKKQLQDLDTEIDKLSNSSPPWTGVMVSRNNSNVISPASSVNRISPPPQYEAQNHNPIKLNLQEVQNSQKYMDNSFKSKGRVISGEHSQTAVRFNLQNIEGFQMPLSCKNTIQHTRQNSFIRKGHTRQNSLFSKKSSFMRNQSNQTSPQNIQTNLTSPQADVRITKYEQQFNEMMKINTKKRKKSKQLFLSNQYNTMQNSFNNTPGMSPVNHSPSAQNQFNLTMAIQKSFKLIDQKQKVQVSPPSHSVKKKNILYNNFQKQVYPQKKQTNKNSKEMKYKSYNTSPSNVNLANNTLQSSKQRYPHQGNEIPIQMKFEVSVESLEQFNENEQSFGRHETTTQNNQRKSFQRKSKASKNKKVSNHKRSLSRNAKRNTVKDITNPEWFIQR